MSALLTFWPENFVAGTGLVYCRMFSDIPSFSHPDAGSNSQLWQSKISLDSAKFHLGVHKIPPSWEPLLEGL